MNQVKNGLVPYYLIDLYMKTNGVHNYQTRQAEHNFFATEAKIITNFAKIFFVQMCSDLEQFSIWLKQVWMFEVF